MISTTPRSPRPERSDPSLQDHRGGSYRGRVSANGFEPLRLPADSWSREHVRSALRVRDISSLFRLLKKYAGVSQTQIGFAVGLEQGYVSKIMNGHRSVVAIDVLDRIAVGCGMPDACRMLLGLAPRGTAWRTDIAPSDTA